MQNCGGSLCIYLLYVDRLVFVNRQWRFLKETGVNYTVEILSLTGLSKTCTKLFYNPVGKLHNFTLYLTTHEEIERLVKKIRYLAPQWAKPPITGRFYQHPRQLLEIIFFYIDEIKEHAEREKVWDIWKKVGGETFSYDVITFRLIRFLAGSMLTILNVITNHPEKINVGAAKTRQV